MAGCTTRDVGRYSVHEVVSASKLTGTAHLFVGVAERDQGDTIHTQILEMISLEQLNITWGRFYRRTTHLRGLQFE
jgi:hypothetical protein